jgi:glycosyltransferase involved in cell wall biosynthesis
LRKYLADYSERYDVVHAHSYHALPALYAAQSKRNNKMIFTSHYHGSGHSWFRKLLHVPYKYFGNRILQKADRIICVSKYEKTLLRSRFNVDENRVFVIPNGVSLEEFRFPKEKDEENRVILYVGRLEKYKGIHYLIKVLKKLDYDVILEIVGKGPYKKKLVALAEKQGVTDRVKFHEDLPRQDLLRKYASADLFVLLSEYEAYSISVAEALASRTPCIVANKSSLTEWVDDENCFGLDYPIDIDGLARLTCAVIGKEVGAVTLPDWNDVSRKVAEVYRACQK